MFCKDKTESDSMKKIFIFLTLFQIHAFGFLADLNLNLDQSTFSQASDTVSNQSINSVILYANLSKNESKAGSYLGWYMSSVSSKQSIAGGSETSLTSSDMGPAFRWQSGNQILSITIAYAVVCKGKYSDSVVNEDLSGESQFIKLAVEPPINEKFSVGVGLNYYSASYKTSVQNSTQSDVSYKNTKIYPSLSFSYKY
jgi:hypothetical protein